MEVSIRELKTHLSRYLRRVRAGEELTVTLHGRPVARITSTEAGPQTEDPKAAAMARLAAQGWIRPGAGERLKAPKRRIPTPAGEPLISELVARDRV